LLDFSSLSPLLSTYIREVKEITRRDVVISPYADATFQDEYKGSLEIGPTISFVDIRYRPFVRVSNPAFEKLIAHELTHALMVYKEGFHIVCASPDVSAYSVQTTAKVVDLVDDVIVDARIHKLGFFPFQPEYLRTYSLNLRIMEIAKSRDQIDPFEDDPVRSEIMFVSQYIYAWALQRYAQLNAESISLFTRFVKRFPQIMKSEYAKAKTIKKSFQANDIFSVNGRTQVVIDAMELWPIEDGIYLLALSDA